ncbi:hypothetical protein QZH41_012536, partial [Actinostola sp. cb2023]
MPNRNRTVATRVSTRAKRPRVAVTQPPPTGSAMSSQARPLLSGAEEVAPDQLDHQTGTTLQTSSVGETRSPSSALDIGQLAATITTSVLQGLRAAGIIPTANNPAPAVPSAINTAVQQEIVNITEAVCRLLSVYIGYKYIRRPASEQQDPAVPVDPKTNLSSRRGRISGYEGLLRVS